MIDFPFRSSFCLALCTLVLGSSCGGKLTTNSPQGNRSRAEKAERDSPGSEHGSNPGDKDTKRTPSEICSNENLFAKGSPEHLELKLAQEIKGPEGAERFGESLVLGNKLLAVSAPGGKGAVYLYHKVQDHWELMHTLHGESERSEFGKSLIGYRSLLFVGSPGKNRGQGAVDAYCLGKAGSWKHLQTLEGQNPGSEFGSSLVKDSAAVLAIGAPGEDAVHMYQQKADETWAFDETIQGEKNSRFGSFLAMRRHDPSLHEIQTGIRTLEGTIGGEPLVVGAPGENQGQGAVSIAYPFEYKAEIAGEISSGFGPQGKISGEPGSGFGSRVILRLVDWFEGTPEERQGGPAGYNLVVVSAPHWNHDQGRVEFYLDQEERDLWKKLQFPLFQGESAGSLFGYSVVLVQAKGYKGHEGKFLAAVGAPGEKNVAVYVYKTQEPETGPQGLLGYWKRKEPPSWTRLGKIEAHEAGSGFGKSIDLGSELVVGAPDANTVSLYH